MAFFYSFSHDEMMNMEAETFYTYYKAITAIEAQQILLETNTASYPHMKQKDRNAFFNKLHKQAYPVTVEKHVNSEDAAMFITKVLNNG